MSAPDTVLIVGAGAIGTSWSAHFLHQGSRVLLVDPAADTHAAARARIADFLGEAPLALDRLELFAELDRAAPQADLVIECGPERLNVKREIFAALDALCGPEVLLTTSSSGLVPSSFADACRHPERVLVAHPFNPPHLVPLVELVAGPQTAPQVMDRAEKLFCAAGKRVIRVNVELPGHVVNRLQAALWREAYHLVDIGAVSVADLDTAIAWGPGLRWALLGPFGTQYLSGGGHGIAHVLDHLGPPMVQWWADLGDPQLTAELVDRIVSGVDSAIPPATQDDLQHRRDNALRDLLALKETHHLP